MQSHSVFCWEYGVFVSIPQAVWIACNAIGDDIIVADVLVSIPQAVWIACNLPKPSSMRQTKGFQYRKRYGVHAIIQKITCRWLFRSFNTASGMDCMQLSIRFCTRIATFSFQYRKRYGLHAIPSLTALGTAEPRSGFSKRIALLDKSPQPRGIFLSPKSAENVRKPCNIKETFVHGKNLKLMAFSREFLPSL